MSMIDWAEKEIELACAAGEDEDEVACEYARSCFKSALKAYRGLCNDGHSGLSIKVTKGILNRLIDGLPLTPIEDTDDIWKECSFPDKEYKSYQCKRMTSLFKDVYPDGTVKYSDVGRYYCIDINDEKCTYKTGLVKSILNEMFPIIMPYSPSNEKFKIYCEDFLTDPKNGDLDTFGIIKVVTPKGETIDIYRYFKESNSETGWDEINWSEYEQRRESWKLLLEKQCESDKEDSND